MEHVIYVAFEWSVKKYNMQKRPAEEGRLQAGLQFEVPFELPMSLPLSLGAGRKSEQMC